MEPQLTNDEFLAIEYLVACHGTRWKEALRKIWESDEIVAGHGGQLRFLRNTKGPSWLANFRLQQERKARLKKASESHAQ